ncbi:MAG: AAA family ATPase [bacterium]
MNQLADPDGVFAAARSRPDLCVEFFGLPGSGKTTIAREVYAVLARRSPELVFAPRLLRDESGAAKRVTAKLRLIAAEAGRRGISLNHLRSTLAIRQPRLRDSLRAAFTVTTVMSLYGNLRRHHLGAVLDQGLLQALWSVLLFAKDDDKDSTLIAGLLKDAVGSQRVYVAVEASPDLCAERLASRKSKHSRLQDSEAATDREMFLKAELLRQKILGDLRATYRKQGVPSLIITVDGSADPVISAKQIADALWQGELVAGLPPATAIPGVKP